MASRQDLTAGVLGGLGPQATVDFLAKLVATTAADSEQDHIPLLIDHNPKVPNRHSAIAGQTPSVGPQLAHMAERLEAAGADFLVMVCNTAHAYSADIRAATNIPFISIVDVVMNALASESATRVGVLAADGCLQAELYQTALIDAGYEPVLLDRAEQQTFMELIYRIKSGADEPDIGATMERLATSLAFSGAEILIAGCTEVPLFLTPQTSPLPILSSTDLLVRHTIAVARQELPLE